MALQGLPIMPILVDITPQGHAVHKTPWFSSRLWRMMDTCWYLLTETVITTTSCQRGNTATCAKWRMGTFMNTRVGGQKIMEQGHEEILIVMTTEQAYCSKCLVGRERKRGWVRGRQDSGSARHCMGSKCVRFAIRQLMLTCLTDFFSLLSRQAGQHKLVYCSVNFSILPHIY